MFLLFTGAGVWDETFRTGALFVPCARAFDFRFNFTPQLFLDFETPFRPRAGGAEPFGRLFEAGPSSFLGWDRSASFHRAA